MHVQYGYRQYNIVTHIQQLQMVDFCELHSQVSEIRVKMMIAKEAERKLKMIILILNKTNATLLLKFRKMENNNIITNLTFISSHVNEHLISGI